MKKRATHLPSLLLTLLLSCAIWVGAGAAMAEDDDTCLMCHDSVVAGEAFLQSVHGDMGCVSCHDGLSDLDRHMEGELMPEPVNCAGCHNQATSMHAGSIHATNDIDCTTCHSSIHTQASYKSNKSHVIETCSQCHDTETYQESVHGRAVMAGNSDSAACTDCHGAHRIAPLGDPESHERRALYTDFCQKCHADNAMMKRNDVTPIAVSTYLNSYHGKIYRLGYPELAAGCADCHTAHNILEKENPKSSLHLDNRTETCRKCHENSSGTFAKFYAHGDMTDRENYPFLYWTFIGMTTLLVSVFAVFWFHSILWLARGLIHNRQVKKQIAAQGLDLPEDAHKKYRRFTPVHILLHISVIVSFLGLSLTGLPLKFSDQAWAVYLIDMVGGPATAGFIHRICAIITFGYFAVALVMSFHFLFLRKDLPGNWLQRLFGPDSLCPNLRDLKDVTAMVKWFCFLGPKPAFERWTYWEKFDFLAVFWGMFAIGGSGLLLWFPEFFGSFLPGWVFNIATIVHSDEALLATGFIFTVHFFNTHFRPEKFPMDFVVFNGEISKEEFLEERADQWERYEAEGRTEEFAKEKPSGRLYGILLRIFGFSAVAGGLVLTALMIYAFIWGSHGH